MTRQNLCLTKVKKRQPKKERTHKTHINNKYNNEWTLALRWMAEREGKVFWMLPFVVWGAKNQKKKNQIISNSFAHVFDSQSNKHPKTSWHFSRLWVDRKMVHLYGYFAFIGLCWNVWNVVRTRKHDDVWKFYFRTQMKTKPYQF